MPFVIGSSRQIATFDDDFRRMLDGRPDVICLNYFPLHWRQAGFKPGIWVWGDTYSPENVECCRQAMLHVAADPDLVDMQVYVSIEFRTVPPEELMGILPCTFYRRHDWLSPCQSPARTLSDRFFHYGSTITDAANLAMILFPGEQISLYGCPHAGPAGHFYDPEGSRGASSGVGFTHMWDGFSRLKHEFGFPLVDCNTEGSKHHAFHFGHHPGQGV